MRLIDADALKIRDISPSYWQVVDGVTEYDIEDAPTVNAIPIEWMLNDWDSKELADVGYQVMRRIIADWADRKEE